MGRHLARQADPHGQLQMDLADGTLVVLAEFKKIKKVFTLEHKDFKAHKPARIPFFHCCPKNLKEGVNHL